LDTSWGSISIDIANDPILVRYDWYYTEAEYVDGNGDVATDTAVKSYSIVASADGGAEASVSGNFVIYHYCYATLLSSIDLSHSFEIPEEGHSDDTVFSDAGSYIDNNLIGCTYSFEVVDVTGLDSAQGSLYIGAGSGELSFENYASETLSFSASILVTA
jgi:hypothetical protein